MISNCLFIHFFLIQRIRRRHEVFFRVIWDRPTGKTHEEMSRISTFTSWDVFKTFQNCILIFPVTWRSRKWLSWQDPRIVSGLGILTVTCSGTKWSGVLKERYISTISPLTNCARRQIPSQQIYSSQVFLHSYLQILNSPIRWFPWHERLHGSLL